jgi:hypothetical protein
MNTRVSKGIEISDARLSELIRAYGDCGCGLGPHASCVATVQALSELERRRHEAEKAEREVAKWQNAAADAQAERDTLRAALESYRGIE